MKLDYVLLADYATVSQSGTPSVVGIFDTIWTPVIPATHPRFVVALRCVVDESDEGQERPVSVSLIDPEGRELRNFLAQMRFGKINTLSPFVSFSFQFDILTFDSYGSYLVTVEVPGDSRDVSFQVADPAQNHG